LTMSDSSRIMRAAGQMEARRGGPGIAGWDLGYESRPMVGRISCLAEEDKKSNLR